IFATSATRTCFCLSTTSFDSRKRARKCQRCWVEHQARLAISRRFLLRWVICRSELHRQIKDRSLRSRQSTFQRTILLTQRRQIRSRIWIQPLCLSALLLSLEFIPRLIHWHRHLNHSPRKSLVKSITTLPEACSECCSVTKISRTSSRFLEWTN